ncbi:hypothetical protein [Dendronalium sp. ChiSLP03b]|nr:hypothetical protein [Dendronalium sp. ChiSLP03b]MDZ8205161.1 hypothetical protein [Dendronalium sp. ChiSLP03b]
MSTKPYPYRKKATGLMVEGKNINFGFTLHYHFTASDRPECLLRIISNL